MAVHRDLESNATLVAMHRRTHGWFGNDHLVDTAAVLLEPVAITSSANKTTHFFGHRADNIQRGHRCLARSLHFFEDTEHDGQAGFGVDRATSIDTVIFDTAVECRIGHVLNTHGVEMYVDGDHSVGLALKPGIDIVAAVYDFVDGDIATKFCSPFG